MIVRIKFEENLLMFTNIFMYIYLMSQKVIPMQRLESLDIYNLLFWG